MIKEEKINVFGMTCGSCELRVEKAVLSIEGVNEAKASFSNQYVNVRFDDNICGLEEIKNKINEAGYSTHEDKNFRFWGIIVIAAAVLFLGFNTAGFDMESKLKNASYAVLFTAGVLTSVHCVGMCGGIMLSQTINNSGANKFQTIKPALLYNVGRVISYTVLGGLIGVVGSVFSLSYKSKAAVQITAAVFMIVTGLNMWGFSIFRRFQIRLPASFCNIKNKGNSPFVIGILNGFMPCGPLQTMQIFALGTGNPLKGALSMFVFSLGTVPLMLAFGTVSGFLSKGYTKKILKFSGIMIIILGMIMGNRGLSLLGFNINPTSALALGSNGGVNDIKENPNVEKAVITDEFQTINMTVNNKGFTPNAFYVQKGIPVRLIIDGELLNTCNNSIIIPSLNKEIKVNKGENIIEFIPLDKDMRFSCWMGMINGIIKVVDRLDTVDTSVPDPTLPLPSSGPSCCAGPIDDAADNYYEKPSIYGDDISKVPTEMLIGKSLDNRLKIQGIGYEFKPLAAVVKQGEPTVVTFDFSEFDNASGTYSIIDGETGESVVSFEAVKGINEVEFTPASSEVYGVVKGNTLLGVLLAVEDIENADLDEIRYGLIEQ